MLSYKCDLKSQIYYTPPPKVSIDRDGFKYGVTIVYISGTNKIIFVVVVCKPR